MTTIGTGKYTYTLIQDWAKLLPGEALGEVTAVATDSQDRVYVLQREDPPVVVFDQDGNYLKAWGNGAFDYPHGLHIANDIIYLADGGSSVCIMYTLDGKPIQMLGRHGVHSDTGWEAAAPLNRGLVARAAGPFNQPSEMVPDPAGDLYVTDGYRNARVHRFSPEGQLKFSWGQPGKTGRGEFQLPHSLLVHEGLVYVCDRENHRIQVFTTEGEHVTTWTDIKKPMHISIDKEGVLYVSEGGGRRSSARISILDKGGSVLARFDFPGTGPGTGHGSCVDSHGDIYVGMGNTRGPGGIAKFIRLG